MSNGSYLPIRSRNTTKPCNSTMRDVDWSNRLILGDSLTVMSSLVHREDLAGKVQMIYIDPPYGINFAIKLSTHRLSP